MANPYRKLSKLQLAIGAIDGKTIIEDVSFTAPFKITRPFYETDGRLKVITIMVSAGILEGDEQKIEIRALEGSKTLITSQSYEKIHKMKTDEATRNTEIFVSKNADLKYIPLTTIPFADSAFSSVTDIVLEDDTSKFIMSEIISCGRYKRGEIFQYKYYKSLVNITQQDNLLYRDNTLFKPDDFSIGGVGMLENHTHLANILIFNYNLNEENIKIIRDILEHNNIDGGVSFTFSKDVVIRMLGHDSQSLERISGEIIKSIEEYKEE